MELLSMVLFIDNMNYMANLPDKSIDLAIVDPQYGINATKMSMGTNPNRKDQKGGISTATKIKRLNGGAGKLKNRILNKSNIEWDDAPPPPEYFKELFRVSKNQIIWGGNYFDLPPTRCFVAWDKMQPWENFSQVEYAWTSFDKPSKLLRLSSRGGNNLEAKIHPTQKPINLYKFLYKHFSTEGITVLDTHLGSGSNRIAADLAGVNFIATENNKQHFLDQEKRWKLYKQQLTLKF